MNFNCNFFNAFFYFYLFTRRANELFNGQNRENDKFYSVIKKLKTY